MRDIIRARYRNPGEKEVHIFTGKESENVNASPFLFCLCPFASTQPLYYSPSILNKKEEAILNQSDRYILPQGEALDYLHYVELCLKAIESSDITKLVPARSEFFQMPEIDVENAFLQLLHHNPHAFVYHLQSARFGNWVGATPELLVDQEGDLVRTMSLAGTMGPDKNDFSEKEQIEHQIVTDFIEEALRDLGGIIWQTGKPQPLVANKVTHLKTSLTFHFEDKPSLKTLLQTLHPTPAVGGHPKKNAIDFIESHEPDRGLYTGFLGIVKPDRAKLYVNLRCGKVYANGVLLYAGAGVVRGSTPEKELEETKRKMQTVGSAFGMV